MLLAGAITGIAWFATIGPLRMHPHGIGRVTRHGSVSCRRIVLHRCFAMLAHCLGNLRCPFCMRLCMQGITRERMAGSIQDQAQAQQQV